MDERDKIKLVQKKLTQLGLLDPVFNWNTDPSQILPSQDGLWGSQSTRAYLEALKLVSPTLSDSDGYPDGDNVESVLRLQPKPLKGTGLARVIAEYYIDRGYYFSRSPGTYNITYLEDVDSYGKPIPGTLDRWDDLRVIWRVSNDECQLIASYIATTEPGKYYTNYPLNKKGAARIELKQFKSWAVGIHGTNRATQHEGLVQVRPILVTRDRNKDGIRTGDIVYRAEYTGINQHSTFGGQGTTIGRWSAGCAVGLNMESHKSFMTRVKSDARFAANRGYIFLTAFIGGDALQNFARARKLTY